MEGGTISVVQKLRFSYCLVKKSVPAAAFTKPWREIKVCFPFKQNNELFVHRNFSADGNRVHRPATDSHKYETRMPNSVSGKIYEGYFTFQKFAVSLNRYR